MNSARFLLLLCLVGCGPREAAAPGTTEGSPAPDAAAVQPATTDAPGGAPGGTPAPTVAPGTGGPIVPGSKVTFHYVMKADGKVQQDTHGKEPARNLQGGGRMFPALEAAFLGMKPGDKKSVTLKAADAFGPRQPDAEQRVPKSNFPNADSLKVGAALSGQADGRTMTAVIKEVGPDYVVLDMNHPLAGKDVTFEVEIVSVE